MTDTMSRQDKVRAARSAARLAAVQALYQIDMTDQTPESVIAEFVTHRLTEIEQAEELGAADANHFRRVAEGASADTEGLDNLISGALAEGWSVPRLESTVRAILRAGAYELNALKSVPPAVAITEYVDIAHAFHGGKEPAFVNGVLDKIAHEVRADEIGDSGQSGR